jgi:hypothetical protein
MNDLYGRLKTKKITITEIPKWGPYFRKQSLTYKHTKLDGVVHILALNENEVVLLWGRCLKRHRLFLCSTKGAG